MMAYAIIQFQYIYYWKKIPQYGSPHAQLTPVSILVVVRNGADTIHRCLAGILHQHYPAHLVEVIVIDDHSTDQTAAVIGQIHDSRIRFVTLADFPDYVNAPAFKKSAIQLGVDLAKYNLVITTDADCLHPAHWLRTIVHHFEKSNAVFLASPVLLLPGHNLLTRMQETEMLALMLITGSGIQSQLHDAANGANMAFSKEAFNAVGGYEGNIHIPSGDDMFLIEKMRSAFPDRIAYTKHLEGVVLTQGQPTWSALIRQRIRWSGKNKALRNKRTQLIWALVGLFHLMIVWMLIGAITGHYRWWPFLIMLSTKWICDLVLIFPAAQFFRKESILRYFIPLQLMYAVYVLRMEWAVLLRYTSDWEKR
jgi:cellulose synthase/poly-beta-1,6-N-acetylglucosamine synthase-like glycosyltransferase